MLTYPPMQTANTTSLNNLIHSLNDSVEALKNLKFEKLDDFILLNIGLKKLPFHVRRLFENEVKGADVPTFKEFIDFLRKQAKIAELTQTSNKDEKPKTQPPKTKVYLNSNSKNRDCPVCEGSHSIYACEEFKRFPVHARIERVKSLKRCRRCLGTHEDECRSKFACKECNQKTHHTLLHSNKTSSSNSAFTQHGSTSEENFEDQKSSIILTNLQATSTDHQDYTALLGTALITVKDINGKYQHMRAVLDSGAMSSFVSADCAERLGLPLLPDNTSISGLAESHVNSLGAINCLVKPRQTDEPKLRIRAIVIPVITENLPCVKISNEVRQFWSKLNLADPSFDDTNAKIDMLLGSEVFVRIVSGQKKITNDLGHALQSIYGWVLMGKVPTEDVPKKQTTFLMTENNENFRKTVTYSIASVPILAHKSFRQLVLDENNNISETACRVLNEETYFNDSLPSAKSIAEVTRFRDETHQLYSRGHFYPKQWANNHPEALKGLPEAEIALPSESVSFDKCGKNSIEVLGRKWTPVSNTFSYNKELKPDVKIFVNSARPPDLKEIELIEEKKRVKYFASLNPFLDPQGFLRVGGRLSHSTLDYGPKLPVTLPPKFNLHRVICNEKLPMNQFLTPLCKIEAILNSRPLCPLSADTEELSALTPAHFMIGAPLLSLSEYNWTVTPSNCLSQWQAIQKKLSQHFGSAGLRSI
ncbi:uncharacterized protein [Bemisia tabaci]|uniref:uncharacterized protein n=1 Tax=Bemisia tabaci TaxID=7038 RepID=UPI003B281AB0